MAKGLYLNDGDRVAIIGAGPSGTLFARFLHQLARQDNKHLNITIFDGKHFEAPGPRGCNMCAGVVASTLIDKLQDIEIALPKEVIQRNIEGYKLITKSGSVVLKPKKAKTRIITVFRGSGPIDTQPSETTNASFDEFLLGCVRSIGANVISNIVWDIVLDTNANKPIKIGYGANSRELSYIEADAAVIACGLNSNLLNKLEALGFGYIQPSSLGAVQTELRFSQEYIDDKFKNLIYVYSIGIPHIRFAAFVPKQRHLTVTLVGNRDLRKPDILEFLNHPIVRKDLPPDWEWVQQSKHCLCAPKISIGPAKNPFTERLCVIGDASYSRLYKNGLESALMTSKFAAEAMWRGGISRSSFLHNYYPNCKRQIIIDNYFGRAVFWINDKIVSYPFVTRSHIRFARSENLKKRQAQQLSGIIWNVLTGDTPYRQILFKMLNPRLQLRLTLFTLIRALSTSNNKRLLLENNDTVVIIGGGPSGSACAIRLLKEARRLAKKIKVIIYEPKDFEAVQNQCVGVLSPPFKEILKEKLGVELPPGLIQSNILSYNLHSANDEVCLQGEDKTGPTYVVRRSEFDKYLLKTAKDLGAEIIQREVTDIEFYPEYIRVLSGNYNHEAGVVVGAFGVNNADILELLESQTRYARPNSLRSVITNIYTDKDFIEKCLKNTINVFLPPIKNVEFAAITPKRDHITVNICGVNVRSKDMNQFLRLSKVRAMLPDYEGLVYFKGSFPISPAKRIFLDRFVIVGDAGGLIRPLKGKGINSAIITGVRAAETIINRGVSKEAFSHYYKQCNDLVDDTYYGIVLRYLCNAGRRLNLIERLVALSKKDLTLYRAFYNIISGHQTYKRIVKESVSFNFLARLAKAIIFRV